MHSHVFDFGGDRRSARHRQFFFCDQKTSHVDWHTLRYGSPSVFRVLIWFVCRLQEYACDKVLFDLDYCVIDSHFVVDVETIHTYSNCASFTASMAMVADTRVDG